MRILLTGSTGWLGRYLAPMLRAAGHEVVGMDVAPGPDTRKTAHREFVSIAGQDKDARATEVLPLNAWSHVVVTYSNTEGMMRIYVDGIPRDNRQVTGSITVTTGALYIGGNATWGEYFNGRIDNVRLYNRALNIIEVETNQATPIN